MKTAFIKMIETKKEQTEEEQENKRKQKRTLIPAMEVDTLPAIELDKGDLEKYRVSQIKPVWAMSMPLETSRVLKSQEVEEEFDEATLIEPEQINEQRETEKLI